MRWTESIREARGRSLQAMHPARGCEDVTYPDSTAQDTPSSSHTGATQSQCCARFGHGMGAWDRGPCGTLLRTRPRAPQTQRKGGHSQKVKTTRREFPSFALLRIQLLVMLRDF